MTKDTFVMYNTSRKLTFVTYKTIVHQLHVRVKREMNTFVKNNRTREHSISIAKYAADKLDI